MPSLPRNHQPPSHNGRRHTPHRDDDQRTRKRFYDSALWKNTRAAKLRRDPFCQRCLHHGLAVEAVHVDHWTPIAKGGHQTADDNLVSLCVPCHSEKTMAERNGSAFPVIVQSNPRRFSVA